MNKKPLITYIVPCFNQANFLYESISSIIYSYSGPKEILIIDDCSTDPSTSNKLKEIKKEFPFVNIIYHKNNKGLSSTRNTGLQLSKGEFIQFLDADDLLIPGKVDFQVEHFRLGNDLDVSVTDYLYCDEGISEFTVPEPCIGTFEFTVKDFLYSWERGLSIPIHCGLFKKEIFEEVKFEESLNAKEDWLFWCEQSLKEKKIAYLNLTHAIYRLHPRAMTKSKHNEMGKMWLKATLLINELLSSDYNSFIEASIYWYENHYKNYLDENQKNISRENNQFSDNTLNLEKLLNKLSIEQFQQTEKFQNETFSIVIPVYNNFDFLSTCLESIFTQSYRSYEIVIVEDHSTDLRVRKFLELLQTQLRNLKIHYNTENEGISYSTNKGIDLSSGSYIVFLDCDDYLHPDALKVINKHVQEFPEVDYFFTDKIEVDENGEFIRKALYGGYANLTPSGSVKIDLLDGMVASHLKVIKKEKIVEVGGLDTSMDGVQDYDLALKIAEDGRFKYINQPLYYHRQHLSSITTSQTSRQFRKMNLARRKHIERSFQKKFKYIQGVQYLKECVIAGKSCSQEKLNEFGVVLFNIKSVSINDLKTELYNGKTCILDARTEYEPSLKYFIREYNSYFDLIMMNDSRLAISILGLLWDYNILWMPFLEEYRK